ncbi:hypothetical protein H6P81_002961 [Aristolochia fimbriata]|uniref:Uncharacterized protein n=1 Tax=Aristolochia fimbriata TaxID=158543 RepID=A0AAV7FBG2_ARIFI|nr:hypothetical protein H6P81_002961 [Aristolochia fimbriata]
MLHLSQEVTLDDLMAYLCPDGAEWATSTDDSKEGSVPGGQSLDVFYMRASLAGHPLYRGDSRSHIQVAIQHTCETVSRSLYFPSLVIALCEAVGILVRYSEHIVGSEKPLMTTFIKNVYLQPRHRRHPGQTQAPPLTVLQMLDHIERYLQLVMASSANPFYPLGAGTSGTQEVVGELESKEGDTESE